MSKYYTEEDTSCHCGCGYNPVSDELLLLLDAMSDMVGEKLEISCACRCPEHNAEVGGVENSQHVLGLAADVIVPEGMTVDELASIARAAGCYGGVGRYYEDEFVHVDQREDGEADWDDQE